jgi:Leucine-rich repeat (LRR) protein
MQQNTLIFSLMIGLVPVTYGCGDDEPVPSLPSDSPPEQMMPMEIPTVEMPPEEFPVEELLPPEGCEEVDFTDPILEQVVRAVTGSSTGAITYDDVGSIKTLNITSKAVRDLRGLECFTSLETLLAGHLGAPRPLNDIVDLTPLSRLEHLRFLDLDANLHLTDLSPLAGLPQLRELFLRSADVSDLSPLANVAKLGEVFVSGTFSDLSPLAALRELHSVSLFSDEIEDLSPLSSVPTLRGIWIAGGNHRSTDRGKIQDLSPIAELPNLLWLRINRQMVSDIWWLAYAPVLVELDIAFNQVTHLGAVRYIPNLRFLNVSGNGLTDDDLEPLQDASLELLFAADNQLTDEAYEHFTHMRDLEWLALSHNMFTHLGPLVHFPKLRRLAMRENSVTDIFPLAGLADLDAVYLEDNAILDISALLANPGLGEGDELWITDNPLDCSTQAAHVTALRDRGVAVVVRRCGL